MPKKYAVIYIIEFHVEAKDKNEAGKKGKKAFYDWLGAMNGPTDLGFRHQITEVKE